MDIEEIFNLNLKYLKFESKLMTEKKSKKENWWI